MQYFCIMNILRLAFEIFLIYILYKLVFEFIIPVYQTTKKVKKQFGEMHNKMQEHMNAANRQQATQAEASSAPSAKGEDYIDYEEVK